MVALRAALAFYFIDKPTESLPSFQSMYPWCLNSNSQHTLLTTGQRKISRCSKNREINSTVNFTSVEKLRTLHIAWLHRKVMVEDFRTQYAFFNGHAIDCTQLLLEIRPLINNSLGRKL